MNRWILDTSAILTLRDDESGAVLLLTSSTGPSRARGRRLPAS